MKSFSIFIVSLLICLPAFANKALKIEYRLEAKAGGQKFEWSHQVSGGDVAKAKSLESEPFLSNTDFSAFAVKPLKAPPNKQNSFEVELVHSESGRKKYIQVADKDRERIFCVVIGNEIYQCSGFTPAVKGLWEKSTLVHGPFAKAQAEELVSKLEGY